jgi:hypothetical protein
MRVTGDMIHITLKPRGTQDVIHPPEKSARAETAFAYVDADIIREMGAHVLEQAVYALGTAFAHEMGYTNH